jgi:hypothetical protein
MRGVLRLMGGISAEGIAAVFDKAADDVVRNRRRRAQALVGLMQAEVHHP